MAGSVRVATSRRRRRPRPDSEQEILEAAGRLLRERPFRELSAGWLVGGDDPLADGRASLERLADVYAEHGPLLRAIAEAASHDGDVDAVYRNLVQGFVDATAARIRRDAAAGRTSLAHPDQVAAALVWMTERHLAATFGRVGATDADRAAALETLSTIWMRTLYCSDPAGGR